MAGTLVERYICRFHTLGFMGWYAWARRVVEAGDDGAECGREARGRPKCEDNPEGHLQD